MSWLSSRRLPPLFSSARLNIATYHQSISSDIPYPPSLPPFLPPSLPPFLPSPSLRTCSNTFSRFYQLRFRVHGMESILSAMDKAGETCVTSASIIGGDATGRGNENPWMIHWMRLTGPSVMQLDLMNWYTSLIPANRPGIFQPWISSPSVALLAQSHRDRIIDSMCSIASSLIQLCNMNWLTRWPRLARSHTHTHTHTNTHTHTHTRAHTSIFTSFPRFPPESNFQLQPTHQSAPSHPIPFILQYYTD